LRELLAMIERAEGLPHERQEAVRKMLEEMRQKLFKNN
jgi:hypothetical protein